MSEYNCIRKVSIATGATTTLAGNGSTGTIDAIGGAARFNAPRGLEAAGTSLFIGDTNNGLIRKIDLTTNAVTTIIGGGPGFLNYVHSRPGLLANPLGVYSMNYISGKLYFGEWDGWGPFKYKL
ncbi:MAG: hypothetical protein H7249_16655 [Chitinophagaceae bacterium]|nr:hypothetical protein [Oligoflexus sp.]